MSTIGALFVGAVVVAACGSPPSMVAGYVVDVRAASLTDVRSLTLRTPEGEFVTLRIGRLELDGDAFPAGHLREHMATHRPVVVGYREVNGEKVAYRLADAPWLEP